MKLQRQPNKWSCLPTAFAIVLDKDVEKVLKLIGHDGSEKIFPDLEEPYCRRSFHLQELVEVCLYYKYAVTQIEVNPVSEACGQLYPVPTCKATFSHYLHVGTGVLLGHGSAGTPHAVAWDGRIVYDPNGLVYDLAKFTPMAFLLIAKINIT
jgi:hypothetical protein